MENNDRLSPMTIFYVSKRSLRNPPTRDVQIGRNDIGRNVIGTIKHGIPPKMLIKVSGDTASDLEKCNTILEAINFRN